MIATNSDAKLAAELLRKELIPELVHASGPCITLLLPPYRPGEAGEPRAAFLKTQLQEAAKKLAARKIADPLIDALLEPLRHLSREEESLAGSCLPRVIFRSRTVFRQFDLPVPPMPATACTVGDCFWIRPILASLALPASIYVLEVTKKTAQLLACGVAGFARVELPKGTPRTLDEALGFKAPDHDLINRSAAGPSNGAMQGVQFGTGSGRETQYAHLHDYYRAIDRGVSELLRSNNAPLILAGVGEDVAIYRAISTYSNLLDRGIHGSLSAAMPQAQISRHAHDVALFDFQHRAALNMAVLKERLSPALFSTDLEIILRAAAEGRVSDLCMDENGQRMGTFEGKVFGGRANWRQEDLLNVAAVETLLRSGAVHSLPSHWMAEGAVAAAAFRF
ncbi:MAG: hypothetical protein ABSH31_00575 [Bryobacteraceae bacterium]|jgi:hypothetical protein